MRIGNPVATQTTVLPEKAHRHPAITFAGAADKITFGSWGRSYDHGADQTLNGFSGGEDCQTSGFIKANECANVGNLDAGKQVEVYESATRDLTSRTSSVTAIGSAVNGKIKAATFVNARRSTDIKSIEAGDDVSLDEVEVSGDVTSKAGKSDVKGSEISGRVSGPLGVNLNDSQAGSVYSQRQASLTNSTVHGELRVVSGAQIKDSDVKGKIYVVRSAGSFETERVIVDGNSDVDGDIEFQSGSGTVILRNGATLKGRVIGGVLQNENQTWGTAGGGYTTF